MAGKQTYGALNNSRCSPLGMDGDRYIVWVTNRLFQKRARQPWAVRWWERHAPFLGKQVLLFLWVRECPRPFSPFLSFLIHSFPSLLYSLLPVWTYTLMQTDINTLSHWWPMWCLVSICASSFPLLSLSLPYDWRQEVRWHVDLRCHWLHLSLVLFVLGMWSLTTRWEVIYYQDMRWLFFHLRRLYGTKRGFTSDTNLCHKCNTTHPSPPLFLSVSFILHLSPASFPQRLDLKFHSKGAISAPVAKWVIIQFEPM